MHVAIKNANIDRNTDAFFSSAGVKNPPLVTRHIVRGRSNVDLKVSQSVQYEPGPLSLSRT